MLVLEYLSIYVLYSIFLDTIFTCFLWYEFKKIELSIFYACTVVRFQVGQLCYAQKVCAHCQYSIHYSDGSNSLLVKNMRNCLETYEAYSLRGPLFQHIFKHKCCISGHEPKLCCLFKAKKLLMIWIFSAAIQASSLANPNYRYRLPILSCFCSNKNDCY